MLLVACAAGGERASRAAELTRVVSAGDADNEWDLNVSLTYRHDEKTARLRRETLLGAVATGNPEHAADLVFHSSRNVVVPRIDAGVLPDVGLFIELPYVVADDRRLRFDDGVSAGSSAFLRDGILPSNGAAGFGWDAEHGRAFDGDSRTVFRGATRRGFEYLGAGLRWAPTNQARDASKPTWIFGFEVRFDIFGAQRFDPDETTPNRGVGLGYHQLFFSQYFSRRFRFLEPYVGAWYMLPIARGGGPYGAATFGSGAFGNPQHRAAADVGLEAQAYQNAALGQRITIELRGRYEVRFLGLAQGELWEPLSGRARCATDVNACRPGVDIDLNGDGRPEPNPGITRSPSYGVFGGDLATNIQVGPHVRFRALAGLSWEADHALTDGRSGHPAYDLPGRRYQVERSHLWHLMLDGTALF